MSFPEIKASVDQLAGTIDAFKQAQTKRLDEMKTGQDELLDRVEAIEAKGTKPGLTKGAPGDQPAGEYLVDQAGQKFAIMRKGTNFAEHYPSQDTDGSLSDFVRGVAGMKVTSEVSRKALSVGTNASGGFTVPTVLMPGILQAMVPASSLLQAGAGITDVSGSEARQFDIAAIDSIPTAAWRLEAGAVAESDPSFRLVSAVPKSLSFMFKVSRELLADALNLEAALRTAIAQAFAKELDRVGLRGSGTNPEPRGILNTSGIQAVSNGTNGAALAGYANFLSAVQALLTANGSVPTAAIMHPRSLMKLAGLVDTTGQPLNRPPLLQGMSFITTPQIPINLTVGSSSDCSEIYTGDFSKVHYVLREAPSIQLARELFAGTGQIGFYCHVRADVILDYPALLAVVTGVRA